MPITSITNGVHAPTWVGREVFDLAERHGANGDADEVDSFWQAVDQAPSADVWSVKRQLRERLVLDARQRLLKSCLKRGIPAAELTWVDEALDPDVLTIGFARRVPSYKRLTLMLRDPERLKRLLLHPERPVQLIIAGKAHPADDGGKKLIQEIVRFADDPEVRHRIVFLPNYDIAHGAAALPRLRRLAEQPAAPLRGVRHVRHEGRAERRPQPVDPRRLVGRVVRRLERLGDPVRRRRRRPRPPRRPRGGGALRPDREGRRAALLRRRPGRRTQPLDRDGATHPEVARPEGAGDPDGPRLRPAAVHAGRGHRARAELRLQGRDRARGVEEAGPRRLGRRTRRARREPRRRRQRRGGLGADRARVRRPRLADARRRRGRGRARRHRRRGRPRRLHGHRRSTWPTATTAAATASTARSSSSAAAPSATPSASYPATASSRPSPRWAWSPSPNATSFSRVGERAVESAHGRARVQRRSCRG